MEPTLYDMHCHLDFSSDAGRLAADLNARGIGCFSMTVAPADYELLRRNLALYTSMRVGLGLHPWWLADGRCGKDDLETIVRLIGTTTFVGEVGLDLARGRQTSRVLQLDSLDRIVQTCAEQGDKVVSIHAVHAADVVLDLLEQYNCTKVCTCIMHWFSGSSDDLNRALRLGCYFSVGQRMLASKRGRAYAQIIPRERLLLETDLPSEDGCGACAATIEQSLQDTLAQLEALRHEELASIIAQTSATLLK